MLGTHFSLRNFTKVSVYRVAVTLLIFGAEVNTYHSSVRWSLVTCLSTYDLIWFALPAIVKRTALRLTYVMTLSFYLDVLMSFLVVVEFSRSVASDAPALLPLLAYEGYAYWFLGGGLIGLGSGVFVLAGDQWVQRVVWHHGNVHTIFWVVALGLLSTMPMVIKVPPWPPSTGADLGATVEKSVTLESDEVLSPREQEVFDLLREPENTYRFIAHCLNVEESTIKSHATSIFRKLGVKSRAELQRTIKGSSVIREGGPPGTK